MYIKSYRGCKHDRNLRNHGRGNCNKKNDFCVISKEANENGWRDLQKNSAWSANPDPDYFVVVPDDMVEAIWETYGYCDLELNEESTEVVSFEKKEIPVIETPEPEPTEEELQWQAITDLEIAQMETAQLVSNLTN